ncbi:1-phosphofructokinase family hexose kinase [Flagellimonas sp.]|uniref:1-phosphofructokinase family hexose kinase n=1 Tax=Flagellimonas sp. TaxID=2058762 RepID=UPI003BAE92D2
MILCICPNPSIDKLVYLNKVDAGAVHRATKEFSFPGGKGVHVALGIKELGEDVTLLSFWGGSSGKWIKKECESRGIKCLGPEVEGWNRTCLTIKTKDEFNESEILGPGPTIAPKAYESFFNQFKEILKTTSLVCMSGSWPINSFNANYSKFIEYASRYNIKTFVDCSGDGLKRALMAKPFMLHINHKEASELFAYEDTGKSLSKLIQHCEIAVISQGDKGLFLFDGKKKIHALSKVAKVLSAVGSGDCLMAAAIVAYNNGSTYTEMAKLAAAAGASNCIREDLGMFYKRDVERLYEECRVKVTELT